MQKFSAEIYKIGINPVVDPPDGVLKTLFEAAGRSRGPIPVTGRLNGRDFIQTLVKYAGAWRLYINGPMLKDSGLAVGDTAEIEIEFDLRPRSVPFPARFLRALAGNAAAKKAFEELAPSRRKEILRYLAALKTGDALERNIERLVRNLTTPVSAAPHITLKRRSPGTKAQKKGGR
jgi:hypothetical protein